MFCIGLLPPTFGVRASSKVLRIQFTRDLTNIAHPGFLDGPASRQNKIGVNPSYLLNQVCLLREASSAEAGI
jgi:hypothetical protein